MGASICFIRTDNEGKELAHHGNDLFPLSIYDDDLVNYEVNLHWHDELETGFITEGSVDFNAGTKKIRLNKGDGFFVGSGVLHSIDVVGKPEKCSLKSIVFSSKLIGEGEKSIFYVKYISSILKESKFNFIKFEKEKDSKKIENIEKAWNLCLKEEEGFEFLVRNELSELILQIYSEKGLKSNESEEAIKKSIRLKNMLSFIQLHYHERIGLEDIAESAQISETEALREFKSFLYTTPVKYLNNYRLHMAQILLESTDKKIEEVCDSCGFQDLSYFVKSFRLKYGLSPAKWRKNTGFKLK